MTVEEFIKALRKNGIELSNRQLEQFNIYYHLLVEWNSKVNLTAITEEKEVYLKHFYDSLAPIWNNIWDDSFKKVCDVGAGAGFPSIPIKIVKPNLELTIIDSLNKRINFLEHLVSELKLDNVHCVHARAEEAGLDSKYRGQFDLVTARAVAALNVLSEYCLPLVSKGGYFLALKGQYDEDEIKDAKKAIQVLGAKLEDKLIFTLPIEESERTLIRIRKTLDTPKKYPRRAGKPSKEPIK